jgi:ornithine carbamoyltransferase
MRQLGGNAMYLSPDEVGLGKRETIPDAARVLSRMVDVIMIRTGGHERVTELAMHASVPVINGLSEQEHPCQALADVLTIREHRGVVRNLRLAYLGDGNNVCVSLMAAAARLGIRMTVACPPGYTPPPDDVQAARQVARRTGGSVEITANPRDAVRGADVVYTDVWISMGQERESAERRAAFAGFQVNGGLMETAGDAVVMHCLPAHRGEEITDDVMESPSSIVFDQAENRIHAQKAVLCRLLA